MWSVCAQCLPVFQALPLDSKVEGGDRAGSCWDSGRGRNILPVCPVYAALHGFPESSRCSCPCLSRWPLPGPGAHRGIFPAEHTPVPFWNRKRGDGKENISRITCLLCNCHRITGNVGLLSGCGTDISWTPTIVGHWTSVFSDSLAFPGEVWRSRDAQPLAKDPEVPPRWWGSERGILGAPQRPLHPGRECKAVL